MALKVTKRGANPLIIQRPIQCLFPLEFNEQERLDQEHSDLVIAVPCGVSDSTVQAQNENNNMEERGTRPRHREFLYARDTVQSWCDDLNSS